MRQLAAAAALTLGFSAVATAQVAVTAAPDGARGKGGYVEGAASMPALPLMPMPVPVPTPVPTPADAVKPLPPATQDLLRQINAYRAAGANCGERGSFAPAPPLAWNAALERAAAVQARDMGQRQDVSHAGSDGSSVSQRIERQGYNWSSAGENAAAGRGTVTATLAQWMGSAGHCANLMGAGFQQVGVAGVQLPGTRYTWYWVMVLGTPAR